MLLTVAMPTRRPLKLPGPAATASTTENITEDVAKGVAEAAEARAGTCCIHGAGTGARPRGVDTGHLTEGSLGKGEPLLLKHLSLRFERAEPAVLDARDAVTQANASTGVADTINFSQGLSGVVYLETALPALSDDITIDGPGATLVALIRSPNADPSFGFFQVNNGVTAFISGLKMAGASSTAVTNFGTLTLNRVLIENNTGSGNVSGLTSGDPGGIGNAGTLTVLYSTIANNNANLGQVAGGIHSESGSVTVVNSTISGNVANNTNGAGGIGIYGGTATISNSTITLNQANNSSPNTSGGGLDAFGSSVVLVNTVVAGNSSTTYTSGWPKNQNRCCHRMAPPLAGSYTWAPNLRSISSMSMAAASTGNAISTRTLVRSTFQVKIGMRNIVMPGARIVKMVVMKLTAPRIEAIPVIAKPRIHKSPPMPGE